MDKRTALFLCLSVAGAGCAPASASWTDITTAAGLERHPAARVKFADLNNDTWPDIIIIPPAGSTEPPAVYLHSGEPDSASGRMFNPLPSTGLPACRRGDVMVFADLDNDGHTDAIIGRYLDIYQEDYTPPANIPTRTAWLPGKGDGTFEEAVIIKPARLATTSAIAIGDVNEDGLPDLFIGNWYERYFSGYEAFHNDLLLQYTGATGSPAFARWPLPEETKPTSFLDDLGGRPTYGVALPRLDDGLPMLLELNYGRRWNRLYKMNHRQPLRVPKGYDPPQPAELKDWRARAQDFTGNLQGENIAVLTHVDGDDIRHGRHPEWPGDHANASPRSKRDDEPPFRANGNTFDTAIGDIDNDGDFDLFVSTIIHAWAGESSDRSRFLVNQLMETGELDFKSFAHLSVDRIPDSPPDGQPLQPVHTRYNQGDIFAELADLNHDGRLDLILCSSDYPDPPPHDERLRIYHQQPDGRFLDVTHDLGIDHIGAGMPSLADIDGDGDLDLIIGQSFNRLPPEQRRAAALVTGSLNPGNADDIKPLPSIRLFRNDSSGDRKSIVLKLTGDPSQGASHDAYGTIVKVTADIDGDPSTPPVTQMRQVLGPYGHSGKQQMPHLHFGLGEASQADSVEIDWPGDSTEPSRFGSVTAGRYAVYQAGNSLEKLP